MSAPRAVMPPSPAKPPPTGVSIKPAADRLEALRERIRSIERRPTLLSTAPDPPAPNAPAPTRYQPSSSLEGSRETSAKASASPLVGTGIWTLGDGTLVDGTLVDGTLGTGDPELNYTAFDPAIGPGGLEIGAVHEIKPVTGAGWAAGLASAHQFALALAVRRLIAAPQADRSAPIMLCFSTAQSAEMGSPYAPGLATLGLDPGRLILVEATRQADVLWAIEEGLKSEGLALVLGQIDTVGLTPARRLALAAARTSTPCLLLTHPRSPAAAATGTRWRIAPAPSAPHPLDAEAPGAPRFLAGLERCRGSPAAARSVSYLLEWCNAAYSFRMAAGLVNGASRSHAPEGGPFRALA